MAKNLKFNPDDLLGNLGGIPIAEEAPEEKEAPDPVKPVRSKPAEPVITVKSAKEEKPAKKQKSAVSIYSRNDNASGDEILDSILGELSSTRGRKGEKLPFVHTSCTQENFDYINRESRRRGISRTVFINYIIKAYKDSPNGIAKIDW